jgi:hypothetical protein
MKTCPYCKNLLKEPINEVLCEQARTETHFEHEWQVDNKLVVGCDGAGEYPTLTFVFDKNSLKYNVFYWKDYLSSIKIKSIDELNEKSINNLVKSCSILK